MGAIAIAGPTAAGKSSLAMRVATEMRAHGRTCEIVCADAFQVYRGMDIGTAKPDATDRDTVAHHVIDVVDPGDAFTVHDWLGAARQAVREIHARGNIPLLVGGTMLYVNAYLHGFLDAPGPDTELRRELRDMDPARRRAELEECDPGAASRIHPNDDRRTIRALEVHRLTGASITSRQGQWEVAPPGHVRLVGLHWSREALNRRINARVTAMMADGLLDEVHRLWKGGSLTGQAAQALGYKQLVEHQEGRSTLKESVERIKIATRRLAKSQRTWMRRLSTVPGATWIDAGEAPREHRVAIVVDMARQLPDSESGHHDHVGEGGA